ncbi:hypothetical protein Bca4012_055233 [Brassica carinata]
MSAGSDARASSFLPLFLSYLCFFDLVPLFPSCRWFCFQRTARTRLCSRREVSAREGGGAAMFRSGDSGFWSVLRGSACGWRSHSRRLGEPLSSSSALDALETWSLIVVCAVVTGSNLDELQVTVLRFSKAAIGGHSKVIELPWIRYGSFLRPAFCGLYSIGTLRSLSLSEFVIGGEVAVYSQVLRSTLLGQCLQPSSFITSSVSLGSGMLSLSPFLSDYELKVNGENELDEIVKNQLLW